VGLAQNLNLTVVAEGIEDGQHRDLLVQMGCPLGQGYYYSAPIDATEVLSWMAVPGDAPETERVYVA